MMSKACCYLGPKISTSLLKQGTPGSSIAGLPSYLAGHLQQSLFTAGEQQQPRAARQEIILQKFILQ
jgi:hypothetical protein